MFCITFTLISMVERNSVTMLKLYLLVTGLQVPRVHHKAIK